MKRQMAIAIFALLSVATMAHAQGDIAAGEKIFLKCRACHQVGEAAKNQVGPKLNGLFGRKAGTIADYSLLDANKSSGIVWDEATFREYIRDPKAKVPGTKMVFPGIRSESTMLSPFSSSSMPTERENEMIKQESRRNGYSEHAAAVRNFGYFRWAMSAEVRAID